MNERVSDQMVNMVHAFADDRRLRRWFTAVEAQPPTARAAALEQMVREMSASGEDPRLIAAVSALSSPQMFSLVRERVHQLREQERFSLPRLRTIFCFALFVAFTALGIYWLVLSLSREYYATVDRFWPGILCLFAGAAILVCSIVSAVAAGKRMREAASNATRIA